MLRHGQEVRQHLGRVSLLGQPVPDRYAGRAREFLDDLLAEAPIFDPVIHAAEHAGRVLDRLLVTEMGPGGTDERDVRTLVIGRDLEAAARAGQVLLEKERDVLALEPRLLRAGVFCGLELGREAQEVSDLVRREVLKLEEAAVSQVEH